MPKGPLLSSEFVSTKFSTAAEKAEFGNTLLRFLDAGCPRELFTEKLYNRLSMTFGNIAHGDREGFYGTWFTRDRHRLGFLEKILRWPCHGDPRYTFSDAERAIQQVVDERNYLGRYELRAAEALQAEEIRELKRLEAKYRDPRDSEGAAPSVPIDRGANGIEEARPAITMQMSLF